MSTPKRRRIAFTFDARDLVSMETLKARGVEFYEIPVAATDGTFKTLVVPRLATHPECPWCQCGAERKRN